MPDISNLNLDYGLYLIEKDLLKMGRTLSTFDLPAPIHDWSFYNVNPLISYKLDYDESAEQISRDNVYGQLNDGLGGRLFFALSFLALLPCFSQADSCYILDLKFLWIPMRVRNIISVKGRSSPA